MDINSRILSVHDLQHRDGNRPAGFVPGDVRLLFYVLQEGLLGPAVATVGDARFAGVESEAAEGLGFGGDGAAASAGAAFEKRAGVAPAEKGASAIAGKVVEVVLGDAGLQVLAERVVHPVFGLQEGEYVFGFAAGDAHRIGHGSAAGTDAVTAMKAVGREVRHVFDEAGSRVL